MDLSCLSYSPQIPIIPTLANNSKVPVHPIYRPNRGSIPHMMSASMARSTFSNNDVLSTVQEIFDKKGNSLSVSKIISMRPIPSIIIYTSIAIGLFLFFSILFCVISCCASKNVQHRKRKASKGSHVCLVFLIFVYLLGTADMIYVSYRINESGTDLDNFIKQSNREIYPKEISEHIQYFNRQLANLNRYFAESNSILVDGSKSVLFTTFGRIINEKYFVNEIAQDISKIDKDIRQLNSFINNDPTLPAPVVSLFNNIQQEYETMINSLQKPLEQLCNYANGTDTDIDSKIKSALDNVYFTLTRIINTINNDILTTMTPWESHMLLELDLEEDIRRYVRIAAATAMSLVILLCVLPLIFALLIIIRYQKKNRLNDENQLALQNLKKPQMMPNQRHHLSDDDVYTYTGNRKTSSELEDMNLEKIPSGAMMCIIRFVFFIIIIMLILLAILTGAYYALDLVVQGVCRTLHYDFTSITNFAIGRLVGSNDIFVSTAEMNRTTYNVINDCHNGVHFTEKLFEDYFKELDEDVASAMNTLSKKIYDQFIQSIGMIDMPTDINSVINLIGQANRTNITIYGNNIQGNLNAISSIFDNITKSNSTLSTNITQWTSEQFKYYAKTVLVLTIDACPLPFATIYKADTLLCHKLGSSISGVWLSIFIYMFLATVGFYIFGIFVYKRFH